MNPPSDHDPAVPNPASLAHLGALIGDPVRAAILLHLSDGSVRPAGELATLAGASPQAASAHLARLVEGGLLGVERHGRHRFFRIASGHVAEVIENLSTWIETPRRAIARDPALCEARLCYDHLAGRLGVAVFDRMAARGLLVVGGNGLSLGDGGRAWAACHGLDLARAGRGRRPMVRLCLDWTERRPHLGGQLGAAFAGHMMAAGFLTRTATPRTLRVTAAGRRFLRDALDLD